MLADHRHRQEQRASAARRHWRVVSAYGQFLAALRIWGWFITLSLRDWQGASRVANGEVVNTGYERCHPDPRIALWIPSRRGFHQHDPACDLMRAKIANFFGDLRLASAAEIAWVIGEDFGRTDRFHCHAVVDGVGDLNIEYWRAEAVRRFGMSRIEAYDPARGGARYLAKNGLSEHGNLHFGGALEGLQIDAAATQEVGRVVIARSADMPSEFFHQTLGRRRKR